MIYIGIKKKKNVQKSRDIVACQLMKNNCKTESTLLYIYLKYCWIPRLIYSATKPGSNRVSVHINANLRRDWETGWRGVTASWPWRGLFVRGPLVVLSYHCYYGRGLVLSRTRWPSSGSGRVRTNDLWIRDRSHANAFPAKATWHSRWISRSTISDPS